MPNRMRMIYPIIAKKEPSRMRMTGIAISTTKKMLWKIMPKVISSEFLSRRKNFSL